MKYKPLFPAQPALAAHYSNNPNSRPLSPTLLGPFLIADMDVGKLYIIYFHPIPSSLATTILCYSHQQKYLRHS